MKNLRSAAIELVNEAFDHNHPLHDEFVWDDPDNGRERNIARAKRYVVEMSRELSPTPDPAAIGAYFTDPQSVLR